MIRYALTCDCGHDFEAWFGSSTDYDRQHECKLVECPACHGVDVKKQIMAPNIGRKSSANGADSPRNFAAIASAVRAHVAENFTNVGDKFPDEARKIHKGEREDANIYGQASREDVEALADEGVEIAPLPPAFTPDDPKKLN